MKLLICNKWPLVIDDKYLNRAFPSKGFVRPYFQFLLHHIKEVAEQAWCHEKLCAHLPKDREYSVAEYFGGMGMNATIFHNLLNVSGHVLNDLDALSVEHLASLPWPVTVYHNDVFLIVGNLAMDCDLVDLDCNSFTIHQLATQERWSGVLGRISALRPEYIIITDSAINKMHLNKGVYSRYWRDGVNDIYDYAALADDWFVRAYDYSLMAMAYHRAASYMLFQQGISYDDLVVERADSSAASCVKVLER